MVDRGQMKFLKIWLSIIVLFSRVALAQEEYSFDLSEIEKEVKKTPYSMGGYLEFRPDILWLDDNAVFNKLKYYRYPKRERLAEYNFRALLDAGYEKEMFSFFLRSSIDFAASDIESDSEAQVLEGYGSLKAAPFFNIDIGKKTLNWGKGYAWNPVAFLDRPQDPNDPGLPIEGVIMASADYIKSYQGPLQTVTFTPVIIPVYGDMNDDFGESGHVNLAGKLYLLFYDTDIDFMFMTGGSKSSRYGIDFSRNITPNFEIHGEFAFIDEFEKKVIDSNQRLFKKTFDAKNYLVGLRYLTPFDTTFICEYYRNGTGFTASEMKDYFTFVDKGHDLFLSSGDDSLLNKASSLAEGSYGRRNPMKNYLYLRVSQKEPFDILYFTPAIAWIYNIDDKSYSLSPELSYRGITNFELRLKAGFIIGKRDTEYGEKRNDYRLEFRVRYYFDVVKLYDRIRR